MSRIALQRDAPRRGPRMLPPGRIPPHRTEARLIPFNRPCPTGNELGYMSDAIRRGRISGGGEYTNRCERLLEDALGISRALLTTSCTHALEMAALLLDVGPGDEVIVPSFTFVSTANAFALRGARPVFVDIREDTLNLDESLLECAITPRTKAIVCVHYAGVACEMDAIMEIAGRHGIPVVEDNAHGLFGGYRGRPLGSFCALATLSFHETKNISCGEGGSLLINDPALIERAEIIRDKGTDRGRFFRGEVDKYTWVGLGSSYTPSDLLAGYLLAQLETRTLIQEKRRTIWEYYHHRLRPWAPQNGVRLPVVPTDCDQAFHMYYMLLDSPERRQQLIRHLGRHRILAVFHYQPLHLSEMGRRFGGRPGQCPVAERISDRVLRLPFYTELRTEDQDRVIVAVEQLDQPSGHRAV